MNENDDRQEVEASKALEFIIDTIGKLDERTKKLETLAEIQFAAVQRLARAIKNHQAVFEVVLPSLERLSDPDDHRAAELRASMADITELNKMFGEEPGEQAAPETP